MPPESAAGGSVPDREAIEKDIRARYPVRLHVALMVVAAFAVALLTTRTLLAFGVDAMLIRYPVALIAAWLAFAGCVRLWLAFVGIRPLPTPGSRRQAKGGSILDLDWTPGGSGGGGGSGTTGGSGGGFRGGGGSFGGGGATGDFGNATPVRGFLSSAGGSSGSRGGGSGGGLDLGDDGWVLVALLVLLAAIFAVAGYVVYAGPDILADAAFGMAMAGGFARPAGRIASGGWLAGVLRATLIPFLIVLIAAVAFAAVAHHAHPEAKTMRQVIRLL